MIVKTNTFRSAVVAVASLAVASVGLVAMPGTAQAAGPTVCAGVAKCRVVARVDVDGNGTRDPVGVTRLGKDGGPQGTVVVRVKLRPHRIVKVRRTLDRWSGAVWQGSAFIDGQKGRDLVVGHSTGAHALFFRVITWRKGRLVDLAAPVGGKDWYLDGAYNIAVGYLHRVGTPAGTLLRRYADRYSGGPDFQGTVTRYIWSAGRWKRTGEATYPGLDEQTAYRWGGWRIPGLARY
jgi:hypothetical protein